MPAEVYDSGFHDGVDQVMTTARKLQYPSCCLSPSLISWSGFIFLQVMAAFAEEMEEGFQQ